MVLYQYRKFLSPAPRMDHLSGPALYRALWMLHTVQTLDGKKERDCQRRGEDPHALEQLRLSSRALPCNRRGCRS